MSETGRGRSIAICVLIFVISLPAGYVVLQIVNEAINWLWFEVPDGLAAPALCVLVLAVPAVAGVAVALMRSHGNDGHNPMFGIALNPISGRDYPSIIGAIAATLIGGLVLGPEVAMVSTGAVIGTAIAKRTGIPVKNGTGVGAGAAILALFVGPLLDGSFSVSRSYTYKPWDLVGAIIVGAVTAGVILAGRYLSIGILKLHGGDRPKVLVMAIAGLVVGVVALAYHFGTGHDVSLVLTSGESNVKQMLTLGSTGAIAITLVAKWIGYSVSMGGGFRGGPFFPAIYIGAGLGAIAAIINPNFAQGTVAAGITASVVYLAHPKWGVTLLLAIVLGMLIGGPELIPLAVVAAAVAKIIPEIKVSTKPTGEEEITEVR